MAEHLTSIFVLTGSRLKKSTLVGCKMKTKLHILNRVAQEIETTCKTNGNLSQNVNEFKTILYTTCTIL